MLPAAAQLGMIAASARTLGLRWAALGGSDLKALLTAPMLARTEHFALQATWVAQGLSTADAPVGADVVDNSSAAAVAAQPPPRLGLALVVPKRHAKRAATRNLVKRQMREVAWRRRDCWPRGQLLIRQRSAFSPQIYRSATSAALRQAVRSELEGLFEQAARAR